MNEILKGWPCDYCNNNYSLEFILDPKMDVYFNICDSCLEKNKESFEQARKEIRKQHEKKLAKKKRKRNND